MAALAVLPCRKHYYIRKNKTALLRKRNLLDKLLAQQNRCCYA